MTGAVPREQALAGQVLGERYDLLELLGTGGMGAVYRARDRELDELVALKVIRAELARDPHMVDRFRHEVRLARRVTHVNVARTFELGRAGDILFCTMELIDGHSLAERLRRAHRLDPADAVAIAGALCDGLAVAHAAGVVHRDIKPDNVLITEAGRVVLADFGVAAVTAGAGDLSGTPAYMAPEQARGEHPTAAADIYAVGVLLFEMLTGRRAFAGEPAQILADKQELAQLAAAPGELPDELARVIARATARDPAARIASATELRRELAPWMPAHRLATEPPTGALPRAELATVILLAPRASEGAAKAYLADEIYDSVLARLARTPRLRVLPREQDGEHANVVVRFAVGDTLEVDIRRASGATMRLQLPLAIEQLTGAIEACTHAITANAVFQDAGPHDPVKLEVLDLRLRAAHSMQLGLPGLIDRSAQIERARQLAPDDPRVAATYAIIEARRAFFQADAPPDTLARAAAAARAALAAAPELADAHLASGHVALHHGNPVAAARHYRAAIARAPHQAEAHEYLGRMLLEAGHIDEAVARLDTAIAIQPARTGARWEIARLHALFGQWDLYERVADQLRAAGHDRLVGRARYAAWRGDRTIMNELRPELDSLERTFVPGLMRAMYEVYMEGKWAERKAQLVALTRAAWPNARRSTFVAQLVAEVAAAAGDTDTAVDIIARASELGLFDLHWLELCPLLAPVRAHPRYPALRAPIKHRADAILDALYGEQDLGTVDTAIAPSALP